MKSGSTDFSKRGGGEGSDKLIVNSTTLSSPMRVIILIEKHRSIHVWYFTHRICKSERGICPHARPLEVVQNQDCNSRGKKK